MKLYVDGSYSGIEKDGSKEKPFNTISSAAAIAKPGDTVLVMPGIYRENIVPENSGTKEKPIVYKSAEMRKAIITGAECIRDWKHYQGNVWYVRLSNSMFGDYNPYTTRIHGDWFNENMIAHTGDVYLNHKSMYEVSTFKEVIEPPVNSDSWDPEFSKYVWYTEQDKDSDETVIYANFQDRDPGNETIEITVRETCFFTHQKGINYITVSGFCIREAATQWAPPTAYQVGMIGPNWAKGWIIDNCEIYESKCSGISLGKYYQRDNDNKWSRTKFKDGTQTERECICLAQIEGWNKEEIGSHLISNCDIHDCGQAGIVGHLGCVFSVIRNNHIHHINNKQNLHGMEIAGIKLHAAIDVQLLGNRIHYCTRGMWLDWQAQGTRISGNLFYDNTLPLLKHASVKYEHFCGEDLFIEVSHGPTLVDNNLMLSYHSVRLASQGAAFVHNLFAGSFTAVGRGVTNGSILMASPRYTPYHFPHRTEIAGFMTILHGDIKILNNIFIQRKIRPGMLDIFNNCRENEWTDGNIYAGTIPFKDFPTEEQYYEQFNEYCGLGSAASDRYYTKLPVTIRGNAYYNGALSTEFETNKYIDEAHDIYIYIEQTENEYIVKTNLGQYKPHCIDEILKSYSLGKAFEPEEYYETPDGEEIIFDTDFWGNRRSNAPFAGPFEKWDIFS